ncbi:hypothetical protein JQC91_01770 [Jannaschia sp. Os4]|uniref:hypothetical protein n=1 Tax=Jannaschia sp. Os4 TaxID=2807617 RepID=UPI001939F559|nr:hypothetical protein [Jannaschia sp. Os4]MBM2575020.1 hypothetical protein [Jannaschia sp. Os4]
MNPYGPTRGEAKVWLVIGLFILALLVLAAVTRGVRGIMAVEIFGFGGLFAVGLTIWAVRALWRTRGGSE